jgi:hypothetical protein
MLRFRRLLVLLAFCLIGILCWQLARKVPSMIDPLKDSGLTDEEIRRYRYLLALQDITEFGQKKIQASLAIDDIRDFLLKSTATQCPVCDRWYFGSVRYCPADHVTTREVNEEKLSQQISTWEDFRKRYSETTRIKGFTRRLAVRLHYYLDHAAQG